MKRYVEMPGVIEVRTLYDDSSYEGSGGKDNVPFDMYDFQEEYEYLPESFCAKDKSSGVQKIFWCLVCECDMKSLASIDSHIGGSKHQRRVVDFLGLPAPNTSDAKKERHKKPRVKGNISHTLGMRLSQEYPDFPTLGLEFITEFTCPTRTTEHRMYTCSLEGCKSAWGDSDSMVHHLCSNKMKHNKNYLMYVLNDPRGPSLTKMEVMDRSVELDEQLRGPQRERNYRCMGRVRSEERYWELRERPDNWSEAKERGSGERGEGRKRPYNDIACLKDPMRREPERPWMRSSSDQEKADSMVENLNRLQVQIEQNLEKIRNEKRRDLKAVTRMAMEQFKYCLNVFHTLPNKGLVEKEIWDIKDSVEKLDDDFEAVMNSDVTAFRRMSDEVGNLREELRVFTGMRGDREYERLRARIQAVVKDLTAFDTDEVEIRNQRSLLREEAARMLEQLKAKATRVAEVVEMQRSERARSNSQTCKDEFKKALARFITEKLSEYFNARPALRNAAGDEFEARFEGYVAQFLKMTYAPEVVKHEKAKKPWEDLRLGSNIRNNVADFIVKKMDQEIKKMK